MASNHLPGDGPSRPVTVICIAVDDSRVAELTAIVRRVAPNAFWTVQPLGAAQASMLPEGILQITSQTVVATR